MDTLLPAVRALVEGLERSPVQGADNGRAAYGARRAHELLLSRDL
ncbi:hypothetical protein [Streptomyces rimosus]|nr:hypothetical protein [Streptomyces rimosus]